MRRILAISGGNLSRCLEVGSDVLGARVVANATIVNGPHPRQASSAGSTEVLESTGSLEALRLTVTSWPCADLLPLCALRVTSSPVDTEPCVVRWFFSAGGIAARLRAMRARASSAMPIAWAGWYACKSDRRAPSLGPRRRHNVRLKQCSTNGRETLNSNARSASVLSSQPMPKWLSIILRSRAVSFSPSNARRTTSIFVCSSAPSSSCSPGFSSSGRSTLLDSFSNPASVIKHSPWLARSASVRCRSLNSSSQVHPSTSARAAAERRQLPVCVSGGSFKLSSAPICAGRNPDLRHSSLTLLNPHSAILRLMRPLRTLMEIA